MSVVVLRNGLVVDAAGGLHTSIVLADGVIQGFDAAVVDTTGASVRVVDLDGAVVTSAFVDAHVHLTATGLMSTGLDLRNVTSKSALLHAVEQFCAGSDGTDVVIGHGWDETNFDVPSLPDADELQSVAKRPVYLTRVDVHSALISSSLRHQVVGLENLDGFEPGGRVSRSAHGAVRTHVFATLSARQRSSAQRAALVECARMGIASVHEHAGPVVSSPADMQSALTLGMGSDAPEVIAYWGELHGCERARELGAWGAAGDLFIDGSLGSHTAHLAAPYSDAVGTGAAYVSTEELAAHFSDCARVGMTGGVHAIGDAAIASALSAMAEVTQRGHRGAPSAPRPYFGQWRIEHLEMPTAADIATCADLGVIASVQPQFDALWGNREGMYEQRVGRQRAERMNPFASLHAAGVPLAFGSDTPVTAVAPWRSVAAAVLHHQPQERLDIATAFHAHTAGAAASAVPPRFLNATRKVHAKVVVGQPADLAVWPRPGALPNQVTATGLLHALATQGAAAVLTLRAGHGIHDAGLLL